MEKAKKNEEGDTSLNDAVIKDALLDFYKEQEDAEEVEKAGYASERIINRTGVDANQEKVVI